MSIRTRTALWLGLLGLGLLPGWALGQKPEISNVFPDFADIRGICHVITGESFDPAKTEVWSWNPPSDEAVIKESAQKLGKSAPALPPEPPKGARRLSTLDVESQVIVAQLQGQVIWVKNPAGWSAPCLINVAKPFWISDANVPQGELLHLYGFGLRVRYKTFYVVLRNERATVFAPVIRMAREERVADPRLVYFGVPLDTAPGRHDVYVHNALGGEFGWQKAGAIEVLPRQKPDEKILDVRQFGAKGDGLRNDAQAIREAVSAAQKDGGMVFFPPGTYRTDETILVPSGVTLRGASAENTVVEGVGYDPHANRRAWFTGSHAPGAPVIRLSDRTAVESLTIRGATSKGRGGVALVEAVPADLKFPATAEVADLAIRRCRLFAQEDMATGWSPYANRAVYVGPRSQRVRFISNEVFGGADFREIRRLDMIDNKFHGGNVHASAYDSFVDANFFVDSPTRFLVYPRRHCHIRFNEVHQAHRSSWENAEEIFLVHGGGAKSFGLATSASPTTLADKSQAWKPGFYKDATALIISGRGFGQYRTVVDNTTDTLTLESPWRIVPDGTSEYVVGAMHVENDFFANLNNTPLRLSLWLDCIANIVDMHRDVFSKGSDIWGQDRSAVDEKGVASQPERFHPAYYNMIVNSWMDGSYAHLFSGASASNVHLGTPMFANFVFGNKIRQPHTHRTGFDWFERALAGIVVGNCSGMEKHPGVGRPRRTDMTKPQDARVGLSHSIIANNFISFTNTGIQVADFARKTFLLGNEFQEVRTPIQDWGAKTLRRDNKVFTVDETGESFAPIPDTVGDRDIKPRERPKFTVPQTQTRSALFETIVQLHVFVSEHPYAVYSDVFSEEKERQCQQNLEALYGLLKQYDQKHGRLPPAAFFPARPLSDPASLVVMLGKEAQRHLVCPTSGQDFQQLGLNYVWNEKLNGKKLSDAADAWLLMDFVATHDWMTANHFCGHRGAVNVLLANGRVQCGLPYAYEARSAKDKTVKTWLDWANE